MRPFHANSSTVSTPKLHQQPTFIRAIQPARSQNSPKSNYDNDNDIATSLKTVNALYNVCVDLILEHLSNFSESTKFSTMPLSILGIRLAKLSSAKHPTTFYNDLLRRFGGLLRFLEIVTKMKTIDFPRGLEILVESAPHGKGADWFVKLRQIKFEENLEVQDNKTIHINNTPTAKPVIDTTKYPQAQESLNDWILEREPRPEKKNLKTKVNLEKYETMEKEKKDDNDGIHWRPQNLFSLNRLLQGDALSKEIMQLNMLKKPPQFIIEHRAYLLLRIKEGLRMFWPQIDLQVVMFGSAANGLDTADSDLDICIVAPQSTTLRNNFELQYHDMNIIADVLNMIGMINVCAVPTALVPICKFTDPMLNLSCDINTNNLLAIENTRLIRAYCSIDKRVAPFIIAIKHWARKREINDPARVGARTLSSYAYVLMALFYLTAVCNPPVLPPLQDPKLCARAGILPRKILYYSREGWIQLMVMWYDRKVVIENKPLLKYGKPAWDVDSSGTMHWVQMNAQTIGSLLRDFFEYYSQKFDYGTKVVSLAESKCLSKSNKDWHNDYFGIEDPFILYKNIAAGCKTEQMKWIKQELDRATDLLNVDTGLDDLCIDYSDEVAQIERDDVIDIDLYTYKSSAMRDYT